MLALSLIIEINFFNVFYNFESKYETHLTLTLIVFALDRETKGILDSVDKDLIKLIPYNLNSYFINL